MDWCLDNQKVFETLKTKAAVTGRLGTVVRGPLVPARQHEGKRIDAQTGRRGFTSGLAAAGFIIRAAGGAVVRVGRFKAYAHVLNPANGFDGAPVRWSKIAREVGVELTAETQ